MNESMSQYWMCTPAALRGFFETIESIQKDYVQAILEGPAAVKSSDGSADDGGGFGIEGTTAVISIRGILLDRVPAWLKKYVKAGYLELTGQDDLRRQILQAAADPSIGSIRLEVESPGGMVAGTMDTAEAIAAAATVKPVTARVTALAASAAYYLISQAGRIDSGADAEIGSIGVYTVYYDLSEAAREAGVRAVVIRSGPIKGMGVAGAPITEEQIESMQKVIDAMTDQFISAVASGRKLEKAAVRKLADGSVWLAPKAKKLGLIDGLTSGTIQFELERKQHMEEKEKQEAQAAVEKARAEGQAEAAGRMKSLREAFADDLPFALQQFEAGATVEQAKAAYCEVLAAKVKQLTEANAALAADLAKKQAAPASSKTAAGDGAEPIPHSSTDGGTGQPDEFAAYVKQYQSEGLSRAKAIAKAVRLHPEAHSEHLRRQTVVVE